MACSEPDDKTRLLYEIRNLEREESCLDKELASLLTRKKMIGHRIADLRYELNHPLTYFDLMKNS